MNILMTGGTGFIGQHLIESLTGDGHQVSVLSRSKRSSTNRLLSYLEWDGKTMPMAIGFYEGVINLAGAPIAGRRWTNSHKDKVLNSRLDATRACVDYINRSTRAPKFFISASAIGYYGGLREEEATESSDAGEDFIASVCTQWEAAGSTAKCRTVFPRIGIVLGKGGGALEELKKVYKLWMGGKLGSGKQGFSWIHIDDIVGAIRFAMEHESVEGPINLSAPNWVNQATFSDELAQAMNVMDIWTVPKFGLKLIFGEQAVLFWGGQKVKPAALEEAGYEFSFPNLKPALEALLS